MEGDALSRTRQKFSLAFLLETSTPRSPSFRLSLAVLIVALGKQVEVTLTLRAHYKYYHEVYIKVYICITLFTYTWAGAYEKKGIDTLVLECTDCAHKSDPMRLLIRRKLRFDEF